MGENRSLDEFVPASDDADEGDGADGTEAGEGRDGPGASDGVSGAGLASTTDETTADVGAHSEAGTGTETADGPRTTYRWSADGFDCPICGTTVERQWRDGDRFVCADCKEW